MPYFHGPIHICWNVTSLFRVCVCVCVCWSAPPWRNPQAMAFSQLTLTTNTRLDSVSQAQDAVWWYYLACTKIVPLLGSCKHLSEVTTCIKGRHSPSRCTIVLGCMLLLHSQWSSGFHAAAPWPLPVNQGCHGDVSPALAVSLLSVLEGHVTCTMQWKGGRVCVYVCVCMQACVCMYVWICVYVHACGHVCICGFILVWMCVSLCVYGCMNIHKLAHIYYRCILEAVQLISGCIIIVKYHST